MTLPRHPLFKLPVFPPALSHPEKRRVGAVLLQRIEHQGRELWVRTVVEGERDGRFLGDHTLEEELPEWSSLRKKPRNSASHAARGAGAPPRRGTVMHRLGAHAL